LAKIEADIADLEQTIANIDVDLLDGEKYDKLTENPDFFDNYQAKKTKLYTLMVAWEELHGQLES